MGVQEHKAQTKTDRLIAAVERLCVLLEEKKDLGPPEDKTRHPIDMTLVVDDGGSLSREAFSRHFPERK